MPILCAVDFSPCAQSALLIGRSLARRLDEPLFLLHVVEPPASAFPQTNLQMAALEMALTESAAIQLSAAARECEQAGVKVQVGTRIGSAASLILDTASELDARLIVMGTHGRKHLARLLLGSVAATVVRKSACPVLVTRAFPVHTERWARGNDLMLMVGLDGTPASTSALAWLYGQGQQLPQKRFLIRLFWPPQEAERHGLPEPWLDIDPHPAVAQLLVGDLKKTLAPFGGDQGDQVRFRTAHANGADVLADEAGDAGADALVIGVAKHGLATWHPLSVPDLLRAAPCPVLCIPEQAVTASTGRDSSSGPPLQQAETD